MSHKRNLVLRREKIIAKLPSMTELIRGSLIERHRRCGKPNCHCAKGPGHRTWYLTVSFARGRTEQVTVPDELVPSIKQWIANYEKWWNSVERISAINRELLRQRWIEVDRKKKHKG